MRTLLTLTLASVLASSTALASSHGDSPAVQHDPALDSTDLWAWQDSASTMTIVAAYNGLAAPGAGPTYAHWVTWPQAIYEIHIDTNGDGVEDITYQFRFTNIDNGQVTAGRVTSPPTYGALSSSGDVLQKMRQAYTVTRIAGPRRSGPASAVSATLPVAPPSTGRAVTWGRAGGYAASVAGTVAVTNGSTSVTGMGTGFTTQLTNGERVKLSSDGNVYTVTSIGADTTMTISPAYTGPSNGAAVVYVQGSGPGAGSDYEARMGSDAINTVALINNERVFVGPRAETFFGDLGALSDRAKLRTFGSTPPLGAAVVNGTTIPDYGQYGGGYNSFAGKNAQVIALQIPLSTLGGSFAVLGITGHVGVWSSASRSRIRMIGRAGTGSFNRDATAGSFVQVSRVGNPLVNDLFIPYDLKDAWNADVPSNDAQRWAQYYATPELAQVLASIYGIAVPPSPRNELVTLFTPDTLKVRVTLPTPLTASGAAFLGGPSGVLDGRTFGDDVVDAFLKIAAGILVEPGTLGGFGLASAFGMPDFYAPGFNGSSTPLNNLLGDGVDYGTNGASSGFAVTPTTFPYAPTPWDGTEVGNDYYQSPRHP